MQENKEEVGKNFIKCERQQRKKKEIFFRRVGNLDSTNDNDDENDEDASEREREKERENERKKKQTKK